MNSGRKLSLILIFMPVLTIIWFDYISVPYWLFQVAIFVTCMAYAGISRGIVNKHSGFWIFVISRVLVVGYIWQAISALMKLA